MEEEESVTWEVNGASHRRQREVVERYLKREQQPAADVGGEGVEQPVAAARRGRGSYIYYEYSSFIQLQHDRI